VNGYRCHRRDQGVSSRRGAGERKSRQCRDRRMGRDIDSRFLPLPRQRCGDGPGARRAQKHRYVHLTLVLISRALGEIKPSHAALGKEGAARDRHASPTRSCARSDRPIHEDRKKKIACLPTFRPNAVIRRDADSIYRIPVLHQQMRDEMVWPHARMHRQAGRAQSMEKWSRQLEHPQNEITIRRWSASMST